MRGALAEVEHRIVDARAHVVQRDELLRAWDVLAAYRFAERRDVALLDVGDQLRPRREAGFAGDGELRVAERERSRGLAGVGSHGADPGECGRIAGASRLDQILGELVLLFEIGGDGGESGVDTDDLLRNAPVSASWAEERSARDRRTTVTGGRRPSADRRRPVHAGPRVDQPRDGRNPLVGQTAGAGRTLELPAGGVVISIVTQGIVRHEAHDDDLD